MTPQQMDAVRRSFDKMTAFNALAGVQFCEHLFAIDPTLRRRLDGDLDEQGRGVMRSLAAAIRHLSDPGAAAAALLRDPAGDVLGTPSAAVAEALLWTLKNNLGPEFTPEVRAAWLALHDLVIAAAARN
ncbi:hypothetical protein [Azospirillum sp. ST 5-10]|uniref:hypothetical protein n=1 Tax=unclassified Azospirillum TaxID=2630922 RepID=UPI003F49D855